MSNTTDEWLWTDWHGEECPVLDGVKFMVRFDDGEVIGPCMNMPKEEWINAPCIAAYAILNPDYVAPAPTGQSDTCIRCGGSGYRVSGQHGITCEICIDAIINKTETCGANRDGVQVTFARVDPLLNERRQPAPVDHVALLKQCGEALDAMVVEYCDYMKINNLGNPETQHNIKLARAALEAVKKAGVMW